MEQGEDIIDRYQEAPVSSYDMGLNDLDVVPDLHSEKFHRARTYSEKGLQVKDNERKRRRLHCHHHQIYSNVNTKAVSTTESEPNLRTVPDISNESITTSKKTIQYRIHNYYVLYIAVGIFTLLLSLILIHFYAQQLDRFLSCDRTRYYAVAYNERGISYYVCKAMKTIRTPEIRFLDH